MAVRTVFLANVHSIVGREVLLSQRKCLLPWVFAVPLWTNRECQARCSGHRFCVPGSMSWYPVSLQSFLEQRRFNAFLRFTQFLVTQEKTLVTNTAVLSSVCCGRCCPDVWNEGWVQPGQRMQQILQRLSGSLLQMQPNEGNSVLTAREQFFFITELALGKTSLLSASHLASS